MKIVILAGGFGTRFSEETHKIPKPMIKIKDQPILIHIMNIFLKFGYNEFCLALGYKADLINNYLLDNGFTKIESYTNDNSEALLMHKNNIHVTTVNTGTNTMTGGRVKRLKKFIGNENVCLILGDNLFHGAGLTGLVRDAASILSGGMIFGQRVSDPERYGVVVYDENNRATSIEEKPQNPKSKYAITGLYFYDCHAPKYAKQLKPSQRGELEITDLNNIYLERSSLNVIRLNRGFAWLDTGTHNSLIEAHQFVQTVEKRQDIKIACLEEIAYRRGWINQQQLQELAKPLLKSGYGKYLMQLLTE